MEFIGCVRMPWERLQRDSFSRWLVVSSCPECEALTAGSRIRCARKWKVACLVVSLIVQTSLKLWFVPFFSSNVFLPYSLYLTEFLPLFLNIYICGSICFACVSVCLSICLPVRVFFLYVYLVIFLSIFLFIAIIISANISIFIPNPFFLRVKNENHDDKSFESKI